MTNSADLTIGFDSYNYGAARNVYAPVDGVDYVKIRRLPMELLRPLQRREFGKIHVPLHRQDCDLTHLWERVAVTGRPWGTSFSSTMPYIDGSRRPRLHQALVDRIVRDNCRFLVGISEHAAIRFRDALDDETWNETRHKFRVIPPHHDPGVRSTVYQPPEPDEPLELLFVGVTFFGKGGQAVLETFERLQSDLNLRLTVVSPVLGDDYACTPPPDVNPAAIRARLQEHPNITWVERLTNDEVLAAMQTAHIGLLPTLADTFGYVVLEFMGLGVPTVVSDVQALPEFTNSDSNFVVHVPTDERGVWTGRGPIADRPDHYHEAMRSLSEQLASIVQQARANPRALEVMSRAAMARIEGDFSAAKRSHSMYQLYTELL